MRCLLFSIPLIAGCLLTPEVQSKTLDLDTGRMFGITTDGLGVGSGAENAAILRMLKLAEAIAALERELVARGDYLTILAVAADLINMAPENTLLRHLHALSLAASGDSSAATAVLDVFPETANHSVWAGLAQAMILRDKGALEAAKRLTEDVLMRMPDNAYAHNLAGTISFAQQALDQARHHFAKAAELQPGSDTYLANLGAVERLLGDTDTATLTLQAALRINPAACGALINYAGLLRDMGDLAGAQAQLEACMQAEPGNHNATRQVIEILTERRQYDLALGLATRHADILPEPAITKARLALLLGDLALAETALTKARPDPGTTLLMAFAAAGRGDLAKAQDLAHGLLEHLPDRPDIAVGVIGFLSTGGMVDPALRQDRNEDPILAYLLGLGAAVAGDEATMRKTLLAKTLDIPALALTGFPEEQITRIAGSPATPWLAAALTLRLAGYHQLSYAATLRASEADPDLALAHVIRAQSAAELRHGAKALAALEQALELAPAGTAPNLQRGEAAMAMGDLPGAMDHFEQVLNVADSAAAALRLGLVADRMGEDAKAEIAYERLIRITPQSFIGYNQLAWFLATRERDLDRALGLAQQADALMPQNASIQDTIGWILHLQGDTATGVFYLRRSFEIAGWAIPEIGLHLAQAELALGNQAVARDLLQVLAARPEGDLYAHHAKTILEQF